MRDTGCTIGSVRVGRVFIGMQKTAATLLAQGVKAREYDSKIEGRQWQDKKRNNLCIFCDRPHLSKLCRTISSVDDRKAIVRRKKKYIFFLNRCYICLRPNHMARDCNSKTSCNKCRGRHHEAICNQRERAAGNYSSMNTSPQTDNRINHSTYNFISTNQ